MNREASAIFAESLSRCLADAGFLDRFYELFLGSSETVATKFENTDFDRQKRALTSSLYLMVMAMEGGDAAVTYLASVAERHSRRELDIRPALYEVWLDCLIRAAGEYDPLFSEDVEQSWRETMQFGIELMRERY